MKYEIRGKYLVVTGTSVQDYVIVPMRGFLVFACMTLAGTQSGDEGFHCALSATAYPLGQINAGPTQDRDGVIMELHAQTRQLTAVGFATMGLVTTFQGRMPVDAGQRLYCSVLTNTSALSCSFNLHFAEK